MRGAILVGSVLLIIIILAGYTIFNKKHRSVDAEKFTAVAARELFIAFKQDEARANGLYLDKVVQVDGIISAILSNQDGEQVLLLDGGDALYGVSCSMAEELKGIQPGMPVKIKGICTGYLSDVIITRGRLVN